MKAPETSRPEDLSAAIEPIRWERDPNGIVILTMDDPRQRVNTMNPRFAAAFAASIARLEAERSSIQGVVIRSAKSSFLAGGDLRLLAAVAAPERLEFVEGLKARKQRLRRLEKLGIPVVALIEGPALGGGLELSLACHNRIVTDSPRVTLGLPEINLGLIPGGGGVARLTHLLGAELACSLILSGKQLTSDEALTIGLVDAVHAQGEALDRARDLVLSGAARRLQPWDGANHGSPRGAKLAAGVAQRALRYPGTLQAGSPNPAPAEAYQLLLRVASSDIDEALEAETDTFVRLVVDDRTKATIQVLFFDTQATRSARRDQGKGPLPTRLVVGGVNGERLVEDVGADGKLTIIRATNSADAAALLAETTEDCVTLWAGHLDGLPIPAHLQSGPGAPVCIVMSALPAGGPSHDAHDSVIRAWQVADASPGGGLYVEVQRAVDSTASDTVIAAFQRLGATAVELAEGAESFAHTIRTALVDAAQDISDNGRSLDQVVEAASIVGVWVPNPHRTEKVIPRTRGQVADLVSVGLELVRRAQDAAAEAIGTGVLQRDDDAAVASVRGGGLPAWTGGVAHRPPDTK
jgi:enoyl-CoA hydratase/carnithine racemase